MLKVNKFTLIVLINSVWAFAGINILDIGLQALVECGSPLLVILLGALLVFIPFFLYVFRRMSKKNIRRIKAQKGEQHPFYSLLDIKGYLVMLLMIHLGVIIRTYALLNRQIIAMFYIGLSVALIMTAVQSFITLYKEK